METEASHSSVATDIRSHRQQTILVDSILCSSKLLLLSCSLGHFYNYCTLYIVLARYNDIDISGLVLLDLNHSVLLHLPINPRPVQTPNNAVDIEPNSRLHPGGYHRQW